MTDNEIRELWEEVCHIVNTGNYHDDENKYEETILRIVSILGWKEFRGEVVRQPNLPAGTQTIRPDFVLKINETNSIVTV